MRKMITTLAVATSVVVAVGTLTMEPSSATSDPQPQVQRVQSEPQQAQQRRSWWWYKGKGRYHRPGPCNRNGRCDWNGGGCRTFKVHLTKSCWYPTTKTMWVADAERDGYAAGAIYRIKNPNGRQGVCTNPHGSGYRAWTRCHFWWASSGRHRMAIKAAACKDGSTRWCRVGGYAAWGNQNPRWRGLMRIGRF